jgi:glucose-1-phosphate thymidylyltransferase
VPYEVIGVLPAAGQATRIAPLPCSKELYPIGFRPADEGQSVRPKVISHYVLEKMRLAGISKAYVILRDGKWDIPAYFADGALVGIHLAYLMMRLPFGPPYTVDQAYPFVKDALVVFGFPDIWFQPDDTFVQLLSRQSSTRADIVLALFPAHDPAQMDMVDMDDRGRARSIRLKPPHTHLRYGWVCAVWTPAFTDFMREYLTRDRELIHAAPTRNDPDQHELSFGAVFQAAIERGLAVDTVAFPDGIYIDIGTPQGLQNALREAHP